MGLEALQKKFEKEVETFKKIQKDITKNAEMRNQLDGQLNENKTVKEELDLLGESSCVYKLIGPALIKQDTDEAKQNVNKRIDYISQELKRYENVMATLEKEGDSKREVISSVQAQLQQLMVKAAAAQPK